MAARWGNGVYSQGIGRAQSPDWLDALMVHSDNCLYSSVDVGKNNGGAPYDTLEI